MNHTTNSKSKSAVIFTIKTSVAFQFDKMSLTLIKLMIGFFPGSFRFKVRKHEKSYQT